MKRFVVVVIASVAGLLAGPTLAWAEEPVYWKTFGVPAQVMPEEIFVSSGTGSGTFGVSGLTDWQNWGTGQTHAIGTASVKRCKPDCATGGLVDRKARVTFSYRSGVCGQRRYMNVQIRVFDEPRSWLFGPHGSNCRGAQILRPYPQKPKPKPKRTVVRTCGLLPGNGGYGYIKTRSIKCKPAWKISRKVRKKFCAQRNDCNFAPYTPTSITRTYRGRVNRNGWKCSAVVKWEFYRTICKKGDMFLRAEGGA